MLMGSQEEGLSHDCGRGEPGPVKLALGASAVTSQQRGGSRSSGPPMHRQGGFLLLPPSCVPGEEGCGQEAHGLLLSLWPV